MGSVWGNNIKISVFGESHGDFIGAVIDNFPHGIKVDYEYIQNFMKRRAPGDSSGLNTNRAESDIPVIYSGVLNGFTTGAPVCAVIENTNKKSSDYQKELVNPRPSHADLNAFKKFEGYEDQRGGGHFSGRLTAPIVFAGALCSLYLCEKYNIKTAAHFKNIGNVFDDELDYTDIDENLMKSLTKERLPFLNKEKAAEAENLIKQMKINGDSIGSSIECIVKNVPHSLGCNIFSSVESSVASVMFSIPGVKAVEFGAGCRFSQMTGSKANDEYYYDCNKNIKTYTNNNGGVTGGITTGMPVIFSVTMKPTPSIFMPQNTINLKEEKNEVFQIRGRHDACIAVRALPVVEAAAAIAITDLIL